VILDSAVRGGERRKFDHSRRIGVEMDASAPVSSHPNLRRDAFFPRPAKIVKAFTGKTQDGEVRVTL
jgi:hypothetical protein